MLYKACRSRELLTILLVIVFLLLPSCSSPPDISHQADGDEESADAPSNNGDGDTEIAEDSEEEWPSHGDGDLETIESSEEELPSDGNLDHMEDDVKEDDENSDTDLFDTNEIEIDLEQRPDHLIPPSVVVEDLQENLNGSATFTLKSVLTDEMDVPCAEYFPETLDYGFAGSPRWAISVLGIGTEEAYFGTVCGLFHYTTNKSNSLRKIEGVDEAVWSIKSQESEGYTQLIVGLRGRIGYYKNGEWAFEDIPAQWKETIDPPDGDEDLDESELSNPIDDILDPHIFWNYFSDNSSAVWDLLVIEDTLVIQTTQGIAFKSAGNPWEVVDWCAEHFVLPSHDYDSFDSGCGGPWPARIVTSSTWSGLTTVDNDVAVGGLGALWRLNLQNKTCEAMCIAPNIERHFSVSGVTGENDVWFYSGIPEAAPLITTAGGNLYPITQQNEVGFCQPNTDMHIIQRPENTFVTGYGQDQAWIGAVLSPTIHSAQTSITFPYKHTIAASTPQISGMTYIDDIGLARKDGIDWNFYCVKPIVYGPQHVAEIHLDIKGGWYSPGFTRIDKIEIDKEATK